MNNLDVMSRANKEITIVQLYSHDMNIYGDYGNVLCLKRRLEWYGYTPVIIEYNPGDTFPDTVDILVGGGGQDSGQSTVVDDLQKIALRLHECAENGTPMLMICGLYQLFGHSFTTIGGEVLPGIGIFDAATVGGTARLIGNITVDSHDFGQLIGYENHSGITVLGNDTTTKPLGTVAKKNGDGNTPSKGLEGTEGARYKNAIGSYLHGSLLPKNPMLADFLIETAATRRYGSFDPTGVIDDSITLKARVQAARRPR